MFERILRAVGRGVVTLLRVLLWEPLVEIVRGLGRGAGELARRAMPWVLGAGVLWGLMAFAPELFQLLLVLVIMLFGLKVMVKGMLPAPKKKRK